MEACKNYFSENSTADVKRNSVTTSISDVAAEDPTAFELSRARYSISTEDEVADKIRAWADTPEAAGLGWTKALAGKPLVNHATGIVAQINNIQRNKMLLQLQFVSPYTTDSLQKSIMPRPQ